MLFMQRGLAKDEGPYPSGSDDGANRWREVCANKRDVSNGEMSRGEPTGKCDKAVYGR
jgi:hypothetical protein